MKLNNKLLLFGILPLALSVSATVTGCKELETGYVDAYFLRHTDNNGEYINTCFYTYDPEHWNDFSRRIAIPGSSFVEEGITKENVYKDFTCIRFFKCEHYYDNKSGKWKIYRETDYVEQHCPCSIYYDGLLYINYWFEYGKKLHSFYYSDINYRVVPDPYVGEFFLKEGNHPPFYLRPELCTNYKEYCSYAIVKK